nr:unnamed protein product [Callosobruchus analis]
MRKAGNKIFYVVSTKTYGLAYGYQYPALLSLPPFPAGAGHRLIGTVWSLKERRLRYNPFVATSGGWIADFVDRQRVAHSIHFSGKVEFFWKVHRDAKPRAYLMFCVEGPDKLDLSVQRIQSVNRLIGVVMLDACCPFGRSLSAITDVDGWLVTGLPFHEVCKLCPSKPRWVWWNRQY